MDSIFVQQLSESNILTVVSFSFTITLFAYSLTTQGLKSLSTKQSPERLHQLSIDIALTPIRLSLSPLCLPSFLRALDKNYVWMPIDSKLLTMSWIILSTGYVFEMTYTKPSIMGLLHHVIALSFACFVNTYFTTGTPYDAHWLLLLSSQIVFAVGIGGIITTCLRVLYLLHPPRQTPQRKELASIASVLTWVLTGSITLAWAGSIWSFNRYFDELYSTLRYWTPVTTAAASVIFVIQWWWIFLWHNKRVAMFLGRSNDSREVFRRSYYNIAAIICAGLLLGWLQINWRCIRSTIKDFDLESILAL